jgi:AraC-like DNA-binding protein
MPRDLTLRRCEPPLRVIHVALARWVVTALADRGFSAAQTSQLARLTCGWSAEAALRLTNRDSDGYIDAKACFALWETAFELLESEPAGERPALLTLILREANGASLEVLGFQMATAPTVRAACATFMAGTSLLSTSGAWTCLECDGEVTFSFEHAADARSTRAFNEAMLLIFLRMLAAISDTSLVPLRVGLAHERNGNSLAFEQAVRSKVSYLADVNQVTFAAVQLERPLRFEHPGMHRHFGGEIRHTLLELNSQADIVEALRRQLRREAVLTQECLVEASSRLGISARTLQRRLQMAGTSFTDELVSARRERAHQLVAFSRRPLAKVACDLGFADRAAFSRAFRRWFDTSPGRVRLNHCPKPISSWHPVSGSESPRIDESRGA